MTAPVKNSQGTQRNHEIDPLRDSGEDIYLDLEGDEAGMERDEFIAGDEAEAAPLTRSSLRQSIQDLKDLMNVSDLSPKEKEEILKQIQKLDSKIDSTVGMRPALLEKVLKGINQKIFDLEGEIMNPEENGSGEGSVQTKIDKVKEQAKGLLDAKTISQKVYDDILKDLTKAESIINTLGADGTEMADKLVTDAMEKMTTTSVADPSVQKLADALGKSVEDIETAAEQFHVDLKNPQAAPELMKMIASLAGVDVKGVKDLMDTRKKSMDELKGQLAGAVGAWREDSENIPDAAGFQKSFDYFTKKDEQWKKIAGLLDEVSKNPKVKAAFQALGMNLEDGPMAGQIKLNGTVYDFYNEEKGELMLSSTDMSSLTESKDSVHWAPKNHETSGSGRQGRKNWFHDEAGKIGYPTGEFNSG